MGGEGDRVFLATGVSALPAAAGAGACCWGGAGWLSCCCIMGLPDMSNSCRSWLNPVALQQAKSTQMSLFSKAHTAHTPKHVLGQSCQQGIYSTQSVWSAMRTQHTSTCIPILISNCDLMSCMYCVCTHVACVAWPIERCPAHCWLLEITPKVGSLTAPTRCCIMHVPPLYHMSPRQSQHPCATYMNVTCSSSS